MSTSVQFANNVSEFQQTLKITMRTTKEIEVNHHTMSSFRNDLDMLTKDAHSNHDNIVHTLYGCILGTRCIEKSSNKLTSLHFNSRVAKMRSNDMESMTSFERIACSSLLILNQDQRTETSTSTHKERYDLLKRPRRGKFLSMIYVLP